MNRRHFLEHTLAGAALPAILGHWPLRAFGMVGPDDEKDDHILVIVQMAGGNDGLNTVIPLDKYTQYKNARTTIAIPEDKVLKLNDTTGLHPAMTGMYNLWQNGKLRLVQGVSYPQPNFSHFRATDIHTSSSDANRIVTTGWLGRYLATEHPNYPTGYPNSNYPDPLAIQIGSVLSPALVGPTAGMGMTISSVSSFTTLVTGKDTAIPNTPAGKELSYLRKVANQTNKYGEVIKAAAAKVTKQITYPANNGLGNQLKIVAQLIGGGLKTKVYMVNIGGFDTHATQAVATDPTTGVHANLLKQMSDAIAAFMEDLKGLNVSKKVVGMTFTEFGRRIKANSSGGTDHGAGYPLFIFGDEVNPGILGSSPNLPDNAQTGDTVPMQYDFRMIYQSILENWFCEENRDATQVMLRDFQAQPLLSPTACGKLTAAEPAVVNEIFMSYPNPFRDVATLSFESKGGRCLVEIVDMLGAIKAIPVDDYLPQGHHERTFDGSHLGAGTYFARFRNEDVQQVKKMVKM